MQAEIINKKAVIPGTLSICMIVKNEETILGRCLKSIGNVADEIVVVDTGSNDSTRDIAKQFGATMVQVQWINDFACARNVSLQNATSEWILWLDADDIVPEESLAQLLILKKTKPDCVYGFVVKNQKPGNTGTEFVQARMFPNRSDIFFERPIHEQMMPSALRLGMHMESKSVVIEHHGYADVAIVKKKAVRNIEMLLNSYDACGLDTVMAIEIADSYQLIENYIEAENWYQKVLSIPKCEETTPALAGQAYAGLGNIAHKLNKFDIAINNFKEALKISPWRADVLYTMAVALEMTGQIEDSCRSFYQVLKVVPTPGQVGVDFRAAKIKTYLRLSRILIERTMMNEAEIVLQAGRTEYPERPELLNLSGKFLIKSGKLIDALKTFEKSIFLIRDGNIDAYIGLCSIYKMAGKIDRARDALLSIEPLFSQNPKYIAFRSFILAESATAQKADNYCAIVTDLQKEFFHVF